MHDGLSTRKLVATHSWDILSANVPIIIGPLDLPACQAESDEPPLSLAAMATVRDPDGNKLTLHRRKQH